MTDLLKHWDAARAEGANYLEKIIAEYAKAADAKETFSYTKQTHWSWHELHKNELTMIVALTMEVRDLSARIMEIESKGVAYRGVYQPADEYKRGDLVTFDGSIWHANEATRDAPGSGSKAWTLAVKRGRDAT